ncbi:MAG: prephenate dehydratase domain-containing protein [Oceanicaulis sp.]
MTQPRLVFLGPEGSFTHQAAIAFDTGAERVALPDLASVLAALKSGDAELAAAALDSGAGVIAQTRAALDEGWAVEIARTSIPVSFDLYRRPGDDAPLEGVYGHEKALAQIAPWIEAQRVKARALASNTAGLALVREGAPAGWGAAGPPGLAAQFGLEVAARALESPARNETVFVLMKRAGKP